MLAVLEHIEPNWVVISLYEIHRVLKPEVLLILTTPFGWTDELLRTMVKLKIASSGKINEQKDIYIPSKICSILQKAVFNDENINSGYFELFMNLWIKIGKQ